VRRADNLTKFMCRLSLNLGASASWNPQGLSRPAMGLVYLYLYSVIGDVPYAYDTTELLLLMGFDLPYSFQ
jgi:hypothetical protein